MECVVGVATIRFAYGIGWGTLSGMWLVLSGRLLLSVGASVWQKRLLLAGVAPIRLWLQTYAILGLPAVALVFLSAGPSPSDAREFWIAAWCAGVLDAVGNLAFAAALQRTDLSIYGPLNAFRPVLALGFAWLLLGEFPSPAGLLGVAAIVVGAVWLLYPDGPSKMGNRLELDWFAIGWRVVGLGFSTLAATFLKRAVVLGSEAPTLGVWILCGLVVLGFAAWFKPGVGSPPRRLPNLTWNWAGPVSRPAWECAGHAALFLAMQWLTLWLFRNTLLAHAFAFFQLAMVLQIWLGHRLFAEPQPRRRFAAAGLMGVGAFLLLRT